MLLAILPAAVVLASVRPSKNAMSLLLVVEVLAFIHTTIIKGKNASSMHHVVFPVSRETSSVAPLVSSYSIHPVLHKTTFKSAAV